MEQEYLVIAQIGGPGDKEIWLPGAKIKLDSVRAALHLLAGNVAPLDHTVLPELPVTETIVHAPEVQ